MFTSAENDEGLSERVKEIDMERLRNLRMNTPWGKRETK